MKCSVVTSRTLRAQLKPVVKQICEAQTLFPWPAKKCKKIFGMRERGLFYNQPLPLQKALPLYALSILSTAGRHANIWELPDQLFFNFEASKPVSRHSWNIFFFLRGSKVMSGNISWLAFSQLLRPHLHGLLKGLISSLILVSYEVNFRNWSWKRASFQLHVNAV